MGTAEGERWLRCEVQVGVDLERQQAEATLIDKVVYRHESVESRVVYCRIWQSIVQYGNTQNRTRQSMGNSRALWVEWFIYSWKCVMILKIYYACTCTNMSRTSKSLSMLQGAHERWGPWAEWPIRREELVTVPQKAERNANRQMARAVICKGGGD